MSPVRFLVRVPAQHRPAHEDVVTTALASLGHVSHELARVESRLHCEKIRDLAASDARLREAYVRATAKLASVRESPSALELVTRFADLSRTLQPLAEHPEAAPLGGELVAAGRAVLAVAADAIRTPEIRAT